MTSGPQPLDLPNIGPQSCRQGYVYDAWNRLVAVTDLSGNAAVTYQYDGLGRKVFMASGVAICYYYAGQQMIVAHSEWVDDYMPGDSYQYVYSARGSNIPILRDGPSLSNGPSRASTI